MVKGKRDLIDKRFTDRFVLESLKFIFTNNNFLFNNIMYNQRKGAAMGITVAPQYACLTIGYLEETKLLTKILPSRFPRNIVNCIMEFFKRYMDDGFVPLPTSINQEVFLQCLNDLHKNINYTLEPAVTDNSSGKQILNFLDIKIIKDTNNNIETEIFYKPTNSHQYLDFTSQHLRHTLENIPFNLAKRIIVFNSDNGKVTKHLKDLKKWLIKCNYPVETIDRCFHRAKLQGPAPEKHSNKNIPFVTTNYGNMNFNQMTKKITNLLQSCEDDKLKNIFEESHVILAMKLPANIQKLLMPSKFGTHEVLEAGLFKCNRKNCIICKLYIQEGNNFTCSNGKKWHIRRHITCNSKNVLYYLICNMCNAVSYTGKTIELRARTNNHIHCCKTGTGPNTFDHHVFSCGNKNNCLNEPFFKLYTFMIVNDEASLIPYERWLHKQKYDTMNA